jgi:WD40 repeat protein
MLMTLLWLLDKQAVHFAKLAAHNGCIWGVSALRPDPTLAASLPARGSRCVTCATDGLLRVWNLDSDPANGHVNRSLAGELQHRQLGCHTCTLLHHWWQTLCCMWAGPVSR